MCKRAYEYAHVYISMDYVCVYLNVYMDVYVYENVCICMYICDCVGLYVSEFVCIRKRKFL